MYYTEERTSIDNQNWHNGLIGKMFYHKCPDNDKYFRSIRISHNPFTNTIKSNQIAIMTMSDNAWGVKKEVRQMLENNRLAYAYRHGYTVVNGNHFIDKSLPGKLIDNII